MTTLDPPVEPRPEPIDASGPGQLAASLARAYPDMPGNTAVIVAFSRQLDRPNCDVVRIDRGHPSYAPPLLTQELQRLVDEGLDHMLLVFYEPPTAFGQPVNTRVEAVLLADLAARVGAHVADGISVSSGRWRSLTCTNPSCCPPEGSPIQTGATS